MGAGYEMNGWDTVCLLLLLLLLLLLNAPFPLYQDVPFR
jgi:hypothetical protein